MATGPKRVDFPAMSDTEIQHLVDDIEGRGYAVVPSIIAGSALEKAQTFVRRAVQSAGGGYASFTGSSAVANTGLDELASGPQFHSVVERIYATATGRSAPHLEFYQLLRCLSGEGMEENSNYFHYDSYVITVIIPIEIPAEGPPGDLIMFPNTRKIRKSYYTNVADKAILGNKLIQQILRIGVRTNLLSPTRIRMEPGSAYLFWGYRSIHTNEPCDKNRICATAVYHYMNPHNRSALQKQLPTTSAV